MITNVLVNGSGPLDGKVANGNYTIPQLLTIYKDELESYKLSWGNSLSATWADERPSTWEEFLSACISYLNTSTYLIGAGSINNSGYITKSQVISLEGKLNSSVVTQSLNDSHDEVPTSKAVRDSLINGYLPLQFPNSISIYSVTMGNTNGGWTFGGNGDFTASGGLSSYSNWLTISPTNKSYRFNQVDAFSPTGRGYNIGSLRIDTLSNDRNWTLPNESGTVALKEQSFLLNSATTQDVIIDASTYRFHSVGMLEIMGSMGTSVLLNSAVGFTFVNNGLPGPDMGTMSSLIWNNVSANRTWTLPDASGTLALTSQIPTVTVTSVFGRTGAVIAQSGDYTTTQVTEGTNLYFTDTRVRNTLLNGLTIVNSPITPTDNIITALGEAQGQINAINTSLSNYVLKAGDTMSGNLVISNNIGTNMIYLNAGTSNPAQIRFKGNLNTSGYRLGTSTGNGDFILQNDDGTSTTVLQFVRTTNNATFSNRVTAGALSSNGDLSVGTTSVFNGNNTHTHASDIRSIYTINSVQTGQLQAVANNFRVVALAGSNLEFFTNGAARGSISNTTNEWTFNSTTNYNASSIFNSNNTHQHASDIRSTYRVNSVNVGQLQAIPSNFRVQALDGNNLEFWTNSASRGSISSSNNQWTFNTQINGSIGVFSDYFQLNRSVSGSALILNRSSDVVSTFDALSIRTNNTTRWFFRIDGTETGSDAGARLSIMARADDGSSLGNVIEFNRAAGSAINILRPLSSTSTITATSFIRTGGTSSQFLKADGSIDANAYLTGNQSITLSGEVTGSGTTSIATTISNSAVIGKLLTGFNATVGGNILATDTILQGLQKLEFKVNNSVGGVSSVFGRTGAVVAQSGDYTTTQVTEGTNLYFTQARAISSPLTGYTVGTNTSIAATDSILQAFGKTQAQINAKENVITSGTNLQYLRGDKTWQTLNTASVPELGNLYYTNSRANSATLETPTITNSVIAQNDTFLTAFGKLQGQINSKANSSELSNYLLLSGGTLTGTLNGVNATFSGLISASTAPTLGQHLTNKTYVDGAISGLSSIYQPLDSDLTSIAGLSGTSGLLRKTAANTWSLDTNAYLTGNQTIALSGEVTGSGTTSIATTISNSAVVGKVLTGFNATVGGNISATDTILQGLQKLEFKSNNIVATSDVDYLGYSELGIVSVGNASYLNNILTLTSIEIIGLVDSPLTSSKRTKKITSTGSINLTITNGTFNASTPYATVYIFNGIDQSWTNSTTISQLYVQSGSLSAEDRRYKMPICILTSQDLTNISGITWNTQFVGNSSKLFKDFLDVVGNPKNGLNLSGSGTNLNINVSNGSIFGIGYNTDNGYDYTNANDVITFDAISPASFYLATISNISSTLTQNIPTTQYNTTGNTLVGIPSNDWVNHRVFGIHDHNSPNANGLLVVIQYGQNTYANKYDALAAISSESYTLNQATSRMTFLGVVTIKQGATLSNTATFTQAGHFGDLSSSSSGGAFVGVSDTNSIDMTDTSGVITADVKISPDVGNTLIINANGLYSARELPLSGTTAQYLRGDNTWQTLNTTNVTEGTNLYYTNSRAINSVLTGFNATVGGAITATDTILQGLQKLEFKLNNSVGGVSSVFGRTGAVVAQSGDYTTTQVTEGTNLYFTDVRVRNTTLSGLSIVNSPITSTDNIITAFGEAQGQIDAINTSLTNYLPKSFASSQSLSYTGAIGDQGSFVFGSAGSIFTYENQSGKTFGINPRLATITFANLSAGNDKNLIFPASGAFDYTLPSTSGTIALTSQIPNMANYLPKSFATSELLNFTGTNPSQFRFQSNGNFIATDLTSGLSISLATEQLSIFFGSNRLFGGNGGSNVYTLPNATGTIALTSQIPSVPVTSIFGRIGDVVAQSGDYTTTQVTEGTNLYFTEARVRSTPLTGFSANNSAIVATDSVLVGFNKAQGQINSLSSTISGLSSVYQPLDADLTSIAGLSGTSGLLRKTATDTWSLDTNTYLTSNQTITLSGEVTGSGTTSIATTVSNSAVIGKVLTGYSVGTNTTLSATDTILQAFGKTQAQINAKENSIASGTTSQYWRGDKTWQTLDTSVVSENGNLYFTQARAIASPLTGFSTGTNTAIAATDTVLQAFGKTQAQINAKANTTDLSNYLLLTGGTLTGGIGITSSATTGQPSFITATTSAGAALALRYTETTVGSVPADVYQFRMGGTDGNRNIVWSYFDNTPVLTIASTGITIPNLASTSATITNLTVSSGISAANIPSGTIASGGNLGLDASGNIVKANVSGGGGSSYLLGSVSVTDAAWSGNTDYTYTTTITGATLGSPVIVSPDTNIAGAISANTLTLFAWVSATNQVSVRVRVATYVTLPATRTFRLGVLV